MISWSPGIALPSLQREKPGSPGWQWMGGDWISYLWCLEYLELSLAEENNISWRTPSSCFLWTLGYGSHNTWLETHQDCSAGTIRMKSFIFCIQSSTRQLRWHIYLRWLWILWEVCKCSWLWCHVLFYGCWWGATTQYVNNPISDTEQELEVRREEQVFALKANRSRKHRVPSPVE